MKKITKKISLLAILFFLPILLGGYSGCSLWGIIGMPDDPTSITPDNISRMIWKVTVYAAGLFGTVAAIMFLYGGIKYMTSMGNEQELEKAKNTLIWTAIAMLIVVLAGLFVSYLMNSILGVSWNPPA